MNSKAKNLYFIFQTNYIIIVYIIIYFTFYKYILSVFIAIINYYLKIYNYMLNNYSQC